MTTIDHGRGLHTTAFAPTLTATGESPSCPQCHTDEFLIFEEFIPARQANHSTELLPASASYSCSECGLFTAHAVPDGWRPPHWFWYS
ncbi:hypothetical protein FJV46_06560 [Arthrobacter agilis]|uniref:hypothetical protein n=1 Tax=Arthrobacter agilis TaxID=37921 RepID=UPI000B358168|nr:hypothetical protein [Arthrobacter agilis]OUM42152.1 hypothetical protein B8W74_08515 [Arthrobacter agilis]PPB45497.1 hypothetical protein CI784_10505 [Arthrobacter agilis]TPV26527.1 hypothetical protein FJV46_06560 [Arthrobacter agilis]WDF33162.1 hypothetical protein PTW37_15140 [Arthrobacter agilis]VDR33560.1 Uncharacterised protein [Arthrobacter agilis]